MADKITEGYIFHVTPADNIGSIMEHGLLPKIGERSSELGEDVERSYFFTTLEAMEDGLGGWLGECFEDEDQLLSLLVIDVKSAGIEFTITSGFECEASATEPLPVHAIAIAASDVDTIQFSTLNYGSLGNFFKHNRRSTP